MRKFLQQYFHQREVKALRRTFDRMQEESSPALRALLALNAFEKWKGKGFSRTKATSILVTTTHTSLEELIKFLKTINPIVMSVGIVPNEQCPSILYTKTMDSLFVSPEGFYLPLEETLDQFLDASRTTCLCLSEFESHDFGTECHNYRVLERVLTSILTITTGLLHCNAVLMETE